MDSFYEESAIEPLEDLEVLEPKAPGTTEEFQNLITNLFEKNGVLNDLRAYLRGHIVTFLRSVENGDVPESQKHFTQRLEFKFQAVNALIAEYLMKMKFGYSSSVFISEIPLANMLLDFAKQLFRNSETCKPSKVHFSKNDILQIFSYLGLKCDKESIIKLMEEYHKDKEPLLMSILKNTSLQKNLVFNIDEDLHLNYDGSPNARSDKNECKHCMGCELCQNYISRLKEKYKKRKKNMAQKELKCPMSFNSNMVIKVIEERLVEEMFEQLKNVYEGEIEILREGDEKKVKRSLANHASLMQKHRQELEKEMESRRIVMEEKFRERKEFVTGLASTLNDAHEKLRDARHKLKKDADDLVIKENNLKSQLKEAEETLKMKGEEMQKQISDELMLLDEKQRNLNKESDAIDNERKELENLKKISETNFKLLTSFNIQERDNLVKQYDAMKSELEVLKRCIEVSNENKFNHETAANGARNNEITNDTDDRVRVNQVVNDLKKLKNINFSHTNISTMYHKYQEISQSKCDGSCADTIKRLKDAHNQLQEFTKQQSSHIELLSLSLREINEAARTCATTRSQSTHTPDVSKQTLVKTESSKNKESVDANAPQKSNIGKDFTKEIRHTGHRSQRTKSMRTEDSTSEDDNMKLKQSRPKIRVKEKEITRNKHKELLAEGDRNPNKMIKEAKLRLRKLEIEAEAVERSYLKFRQRRAQENRMFLKEGTNFKTPEKDTKEKVKSNQPRHSQRSPEEYKIEQVQKINQQATLDFDKYLRTYHDKSKSVTYKERYKPEDNKYAQNIKEEKINREKEWQSFNYLETPLLEFRKLYQSGNKRSERKVRPTNDKRNMKDLQHSQNIETEESSNSKSAPNLTQNTHTSGEKLISSKEDLNTEVNIDNMHCIEAIEESKNETNAVNTNHADTTEVKLQTASKECIEVYENKPDRDLSTSNEEFIQQMDEDIEGNKTSASDKDVIVHKLKLDETVENDPKMINEGFENIKHDKIFKTNHSSNDTGTEKHIDVENDDSIASDTSKVISNLKSNASNRDILVILSESNHNQIDNIENQEIDKASYQEANEVYTHIIDNSSQQISVANDINADNVAQQQIESPNNSMLIDNPNKLATEEVNEKSNETKHSEAEYEDDFSIPIIDNSLSEYKIDSPISILKSEEGNFWE